LENVISVPLFHCRSSVNSHREGTHAVYQARGGADVNFGVLPADPSV
jgi:hypothetical protein